MKNKEQKITIIGYGNLGSHLVSRLLELDFSPYEIYSSNPYTEVNGTKIIRSIDNLSSDSNIYILAIPDDIIEELILKLPKLNKDAIILHCSGATSMDVFSSHYNNYGVLWPIQSFSKGKNTNFKEVPICINTNNHETLEVVREFSNKLSDKVYVVNEKQRPTLHLAAVMANNFTNHLYQLADELLQKNNLPFDILKPLILQTGKKVLYNSPKSVQSGPALRNDMGSIRNHLKILKNDERLAEIYKILSKSINSDLNI